MRAGGIDPRGPGSTVLHFAYVTLRERLPFPVEAKGGGPIPDRPDYCDFPDRAAWGRAVDDWQDDLCRWLIRTDTELDAWLTGRLGRPARRPPRRRKRWDEMTPAERLEHDRRMAQVRPLGATNPEGDTSG